MGQHQAERHLHYWGPREKKWKGAEHLFEKIMAENVSNLGD